MIIEHLKNKIKTSSKGNIGNNFFHYKFSDFNKPLIITFPPKKTTTINNNLVPWGYSFLSKNYPNVLSFDSTVEDDYFLEPEFIQFIQKLSPFIKGFSYNLGYAFSKGGFNIGAFAKNLNITDMILVHPVSSKDERIVPWDTRPSTKKLRHLNWDSGFNDISVDNIQGFVIYDPIAKIDKLHAQRFKGLRHFYIFGMGHGQGIEYLAKNSLLLKTVLDDYIFENKKIDSVKFRTEAKKIRKSHIYKRIIKEKLVSKIKKSIMLNDIEINAIRDAALEMEHSNTPLATKLITIAKKQRPHGPLINKKYQELIEKGKST